MRHLDPLPRGRARCGARHLVALLVALLGAAACDGFAASTAGPAYAGIGAGGGISPFTLVGRWSHVAPAGAAVGAITRNGYVDQTIWQFDADGGALRTTRTLTAGGAVVSSLTEAARWSADGATIRLAFGAPSHAVRYVGYRIEVDAVRTTLYLDGAAFTRTGP